MKEIKQSKTKNPLKKRFIKIVWSIPHKNWKKNLNENKIL